jgi:hypothetical protein
MSSKLRNMSGFGVTTSLPTGSYVLEVEECEWIWCNHLVTPNLLIFLKFYDGCIFWWGNEVIIPRRNVWNECEFTFVDHMSGYPDVWVSIPGVMVL